MSGKKKTNNKELLNELKVYCPAHKHKDLDMLVRKLKGDREKIDEQIQQWWDEPAPSSASQEVWEDVNKKNKKPVEDKDAVVGRSNGGANAIGKNDPAGGRGRAGGRGGVSRGMAGGRGAGGSDARKSGGKTRGESSAVQSRDISVASAPQSVAQTPVPIAAAAADVPVEKKVATSSIPPVPQTTARPLQGAWGARAAAAVAPHVSAPVAPPQVSEPLQTITKDAPDVVHKQEEEKSKTVQPTHAVVLDAPIAKPAPAGGNVWATKGSAHLIRAEKKQTPVVVEKPIKQVPEPSRISMPIPISPAVNFDNSSIPVSFNSSNMNASGWSSAPEVVETKLVEAASPIKEPVVVHEVAPVAPVETALKPTSILNMGHWETGEADETASHDFGFGSFGQDNDIASVDENASVEPVNVSSTVSPARPPPGLGIGMPPMPDQIVHVHELESNLKNVSLAPKEEVPKRVENLPDHLNANMQAVHIGHHDAYSNPYGMSNYGQYPMYNYSAQMGVPGNMVPPQQKQQNLGAQNNPYGAPAPGSAGDGNSSDTNAQSNPSGMPPGMMPQYNPALFYGQQNYQMGQPPGAYGYGFGTPYGGVQGYGFQQVMGQGAGYGQPYDDQAQHHGANSHQGGYNKNAGGGYRGRTTHYQNQYNPGAYGSQPYNMGYNSYNEQRGGYIGSMDPYMNSGGYHQDLDQGKGKPKGNRNFVNQQPQYPGGNQFGSGLQGASNANSSNSGLYNQGGWSGGL